LVKDHIVVVDLGETFTVNFTVADVVGLYAWEIEVYFNPAILTIETEEKVWLPEDHVFSDSPFLVIPVPWIDPNRLEWGVTRTDDKTFSGSGTLCQANFTAIGNGVSALELDDCILVDYGLELMPFVTVNTFVDVGPTLPWIYTDWEKEGECGLVSIGPSYQGFTFTSPNKMTFTLEGSDHCQVTVPHLSTSKNITVMDGPFQILVDEEAVNHTVECNTTHTCLSFNLSDYEAHNIKITEGVCTCVFGDLNEDGEVNIRDLFEVVKNFGKHGSGC